MKRASTEPHVQLAHIARIPNPFKPLNLREAFNRDWIWPKEDHWGWSHPLEYWPPIETWLRMHTNIDERKLVLQAGGCCGLYPWLLSLHFDKVLTFEPDPSNFHCLVANCASPRIIPSNFALSKTAGLVDLLPVGGQTNIGCIQTVEGSSVPAISIDSLGRANLRGLAAMVLDLEGDEEKVLRGAFNVLTSIRPKIIVVETCPDSLILWMRDLNYTWNKGNDYDSFFLLEE